MNKDIRLATSFKGHRKRKKLRRLLGFGAEVYLIDLWLSVAMDCPDGVLVGWDEEDIADACDWEDDPSKLVDALIQSRWLEKDTDGYYILHDWNEHQGWACKAKVRSDAAKKAANARWTKKRCATEKPTDSEIDATAMQPDSESNTIALRSDAKGNAPSPSPSPLPKDKLPNGNSSKPSDSDPSSRPPCPMKKIINLYNTTLGDVLPQCRETNKTVEGYLRARWREKAERQALSWWESFFQDIRNSDFLMGRSEPPPGKPPFLATFDWIVKPSNMSKILNGNYQNRGRDRPEETLAQYQERMLKEKRAKSKADNEREF